jgi:3'(2'), 5'-bisphosphate nucleotidase
VTVGPAGDAPATSTALDRELEVACAVAREAGALIMRHYSRVEIEVQTKADSSPVTVADVESSAVIVAGLRAAFPDDAVLSEEAPDDGARLGNPRVWIIDPLDGTRDFLAKTGDFCVHVGLAVGGEAALGVVYQPTTNALYHARRGGGAFVDRDGDRRRLRVSTIRAPADIRVGVSRMSLDPGLEQCLLASGLAPRTVRVGASVKYMALAAGELDACLNLSMGEAEWDTCAPEVIMCEAGAAVTDGDGRPFRYNQRELHHRRGSVSSNGLCHPFMLRVIAPCLTEPVQRG